MTANSHRDARAHRRPRAGPGTGVRPAHPPPRARRSATDVSAPARSRCANGAGRCHLPTCIPVGAHPGRSPGPALAHRAVDNQSTPRPPIEGLTFPMLPMGARPSTPITGDAVVTFRSWPSGGFPVEYGDLCRWAGHLAPGP